MNRLDSRIARPRTCARRTASIVRRLLPGIALLACVAGSRAQAVTFVTVDGHSNPVTLLQGETVTLRLDVGKAGGGVNYRFARDLTRTGRYDPTAPVFASASFIDGSGQDVDPTPGKIATPFYIPPTAAAGPYILRLDDTSDGSSFELAGVSVVPEPEAQSISGHVAVVTTTNPSGTTPPDALVWAYADAQTPVASASIGPDGSYTLPVPAGTYLLFAEWFGSLRSQRQTLNLVAGQQRINVDFALVRGQEVAGTVRAGGQPMADAVVRAVAADGAVVATRTFADGTYVLVLPSGQHQISALGITQSVAVADGPVDGVDFPPAAPAPSPAAGAIVTVAGNGIRGFGGDERPAITARLGMIVGIAVDRLGNLYHADPTLHRVRKVDAKTGIITTVVGSSIFDIIRGLTPGIGTGGYGGDGGPATRALLNTPQHLTFDAAGNLYIGDLLNHRVRKVDADGIISTVVGTGREGSSGDGGPATQAQLAGPQDVAADAVGNLYISDNRNRRVRRVDAKTAVITTVAGGGTEPVKDGAAATAVALVAPRELAVDGDGNLFIGDGGLNQILKVSPAGIIRVVAGTGMAGFAGDGGPAIAAQFSAPFPHLDVDSAGNLYFSDQRNHRVRKISPEGIITTVAGSGPVSPDPGSFSGDGGPATNGRLWNVVGVAIDATGNLYVADQGNNRIRKVIGIAAPGLIGGQ